MTVYVDNMRAKYGRLVLCHMIADTEAELHAMADRIGVARKWYQGDHYDIALSKRAEAVAAGAVEITWRQASFMSVARRRDPNVKLLAPDAAEAVVRERLAKIGVAA
jgi:hypothetical protein